MGRFPFRGRDAWTGAAIAALIVLAGLFSHGGGDLFVSRLAFDAASGTFPWRSHPLTTLWLHDGARAASIALSLGVLGALAVAAARPSGALARSRGGLAYLAAASLGSALAVAMLRSLSSHSCPWDLAIFGGRFDFFPLLAAPAEASGPGRCFPSGHAAVGFMWIAAVYARDRIAPLAARASAPALAAAVAAFGLLVSASQVARGAHFVSHVVATAAICWAVAWLMDLAWRPQPHRPGG